MDRVGEQARLVLEQTEKDDITDLVSNSVGDAITTTDGVETNDKKVKIEDDDEEVVDDLNMYEVKIETNLSENIDLMNKLTIDETSSLADVTTKDNNETPLTVPTISEGTTTDEAQVENKVKKDTLEN